jgi:hypothetical protein
MSCDGEDVGRTGSVVVIVISGINTSSSISRELISQSVISCFV